MSDNALLLPCSRFRPPSSLPLPSLPTPSVQDLVDERARHTKQMSREERQRELAAQAKRVKELSLSSYFQAPLPPKGKLLLED